MSDTETGNFAQLYTQRAHHSTRHAQHLSHLLQTQFVLVRQLSTPLRSELAIQHALPTLAPQIGFAADNDHCSIRFDFSEFFNPIGQSVECAWPRHVKGQEEYI